MKNFKKLLLFIVATMVGTLIFDGGRCVTAMGKNEVKEFRPKGKITKVDIEWTAGEVTVKPYEGDTLYIVQKGNREITEEFTAKPVISGTELKIENVYKNKTTLNTTYNLEVNIPSSWAKEMEGIDIVTVSGGITLSDLSLSHLSLITVSGSIDLNKIGSVKDTEFETVSGKVNIKESEIKNLSVTTTSGDVYFEGKSEKINAKTMSGKVKVENLYDFKEISVSTLSGAVDLSLPEGLESVDFSSMSGKTSFSVSKSSPVKIETMSGDLNVILKKKIKER